MLGDVANLFKVIAAIKVSEKHTGTENFLLTYSLTARDTFGV